ncbi:MAG: hypothetical protein V4515_05295 [Chloroflexota bacterium]
MTGPLGDLERSLRDGPPDESGYLPRLLEVSSGPGKEGSTRIVRVQRVNAPRFVRRAQVAAPWQFLAAVLVVAVGVAALGSIRTRLQPGVVGPGSSTPTAVAPSPSSPPDSGSAAPGIVIPPLTETYVSARNGFSVRYPAGWTVTPATASWPANAFLPYGHPALDTIARPGEARLMVASQALGNGQTEEQWLAAFFRPYTGGEPCGGDRSTWPRLEIDGALGYLDAADCLVPIDSRISIRDVGFDALVFSGGRVYQFGFDGDVDLAYFKALLATVRLDPSQAIN